MKHREERRRFFGSITVRNNDWAHINAATKQYDGYKVQAILNPLCQRRVRVCRES